MPAIPRRTFLGRATLGASLVAIQPAAALLLPQGRAADPRIEEIVELSRDEQGCDHVDRVALVDADAITGTLALRPTEIDALRSALRDATRSRITIAGRSFVVIGRRDERGVLHAVRPGELVTVRDTGSALLVATSIDGMAHGRAVLALHHFARRAAAIA